MKKKKKAFTLVELLGVLVVLSIITLVLFPLISTYVENTRKKTYDSEMDIIIVGLKNYSTEHEEILPLNEGEYVILTLGQLKSYGIVANTIKNPMDGKELDDSTEFKITKTATGYNYEISYNATRDNSSITPTITLKGSPLAYYKLNGTYAEEGAIAVDKDGNNVNVTIDKNNLNITKEGIYYITYVATDKAGATSYAKRTIIVKERKYITYKDGEAVYYNPETNKKCDSSEAVSKTGTKTGCMKWYTILDKAGAEKVKLLLDHNTTGKIEWITNADYKKANTDNTTCRYTTCHDEGPVTANRQLKNDVSSWNNAVKGTARMITANEVAKIANLIGWQYGSSYFHTGVNSQYKGAAGTNKFAWLFDNTYDCTTYGCNVADSGAKGYWTSSACGYEYAACGVLYFGTMDNNYGNNVSSSNYYGIRPVIEIKKEVLE